MWLIIYTSYLDLHPWIVIIYRIGCHARFSADRTWWLMSLGKKINKRIQDSFHVECRRTARHFTALYGNPKMVWSRIVENRTVHRRPQFSRIERTDQRNTSSRVTLCNILYIEYVYLITGDYFDRSITSVTTVQVL